MVAVDTNILVYAHRLEAPHHEAAKELLSQLALDGSPWGIYYHSLVEFYGIVTRAKIWEEPTPPHLASACIKTWLECPSLQILHDQEGDLHELLELATSEAITGPIIHDARIATCCLQNGVTSFYTSDRDFSSFPKLKIEDPFQN